MTGSCSPPKLKVLFGILIALVLSAQYYYFSEVSSAYQHHIERLERERARALKSLETREEVCDIRSKDWYVLCISHAHQFLC